jgi:hypothetical protein
VRAHEQAELARRVQRLEDLEAIRRVKSEYALAADDRQGYAVNVDRTMQLFAKNAVWDGRPRFGRHEGWEAVRTYLLRGKARIDWSLHYLIDVSLDVDPDGKTARGRWYLLETARMVNPATNLPEMVWLSGTYDDEFVREDGVWRIGMLKFDCQKIVGPSGPWGDPPRGEAA